MAKRVLPKEALEKERVLLNRLLNNDHTAYKEIYRKVYPMVKKIVLSNSGSEEDTEDLVQEVFILLVQKARKPGFELTAKISTFLFSISYFQWMKKLRDRGNASTVQIPNGYDIIDISTFNDDEIQQSEKMAEAMEALNNIGEECKKIILSKHYENKSHKEIAALLKTTVAYSRIRLTRCMRSLKLKLGLKK